jgi:hypothetical protein
MPSVALHVLGNGQVLGDVRQSGLQEPERAEPDVPTQT